MKSKYYIHFSSLLTVGWLLSSLGTVSAAVQSATVGQLRSNATVEKNYNQIALNVPNPLLVFQGSQPETINGISFQRYRLGVSNWNEISTDLFQKAPDLPPCGNNNNSSRTWVDIFDAQTNQRIYGFCAFSSPKDLNSLWFAVETGKTPPKSVYIVLKDRRLNKTYRSNSVLLAQRNSEIKEDCIAFNPNNTTVKQVNGSWKIVEGGNHWMFDFGSNKDEAVKAFRTIKQHGMNKSCFVGRPQPSFQYLLTNNSAPSGSIAGEDCVAFNPATATVSKINNRWKIVDGSHWMFDFNNNQSEAEQSLAIIKKYNFSRSCFVGRPDPSFTYLRR